MVDLFASPAFVPSVPSGWTVLLANVTKSRSNQLLREGLSPWDMSWTNVSGIFLNLPHTP